MMLLPGQLVIRGLTSQQCLASCRSLNLRRVAILSSLSTSIARQYATNGQRTVKRPVSRPKAHTGRTTTTKKSRAAPKATEAGPSAGVASSSKTRNAKRSKAKPKAKSKAKTKARPKKRTRRPLTEKQKTAAADKKKRDELKTLKEKALKPPTNLPSTAFQVLLVELAGRSKGTAIAAISKNAGAEYKALSTERREVSTAISRLLAEFELTFGKHYNHLANENRAKNARQYRQWIESHTPAVIHEANQARARLRRGFASKRHVTKLQDDRDVKRHRSAYNYFYMERFESGDFSGIRVADVGRRVGEEWRALSAEEKKVQWHFHRLYSQCELLKLSAQPYFDLQKNDLARYEQEIKSVYNRDVVHGQPRAG